ncbi:MAG TPA: SMP-30/gluconolactonase/LRE family protein [Blastocatellia bacterium]|nr:SMP-30/gluconolactonase/LRE family protein [Blastocatellia bacterium]
MRKVVAYCLTIVLALSLGLLPSLSSQNTVSAQSGAPQLKRIRPRTISSGSPTFTLRLEGKGFATGAQVLLDGVPLPSSRVSTKGKLLFAEVDASVVANPADHTVQARNPDGTTSASETLSVVAADSRLDFQLEGNAAQEDLSFAFGVDVRGEGFNENSKGVVWGMSVETLFVNSERLRILVPEKFTRDAARIPILIRNNDRFSNVDIFFIVPRPADLDRVEPDVVEVGNEDFEIKVFGDTFNDNAKILISKRNGPITVLEATVKREGRLEATVPASFRSEPGQLIVRVEQDGIQSSDEVIAVAPSDDPFIFAIAPNRIRQGESKETIDIVGANLGKKVTILLDGQEAAIRDSTATRLTVTVREELLSSVGTHTIQIRDEDGALSNIGTFQVVPDATVSTLAGGEREGFNEGCVSGSEARFRRPRRLTIGPDGLLYVTDQQNHAIRTVNPDSGEVCTIAGTGKSGYNDTVNDRDFPPTFSFPNGIVLDAAGTIFVTENGNNVIRRIVRGAGSSITVDTLAGSSDIIEETDRQNRLNSTLLGIEGFRDGRAETAAFRSPDDIVMASDGAIYVADPLNHAIRKITRSGDLVMVETIAGNGVPGFADGDGDKARFRTPTGIALSLDERFLFVADLNNSRIRRVDLQTRRVETYAGSGLLGSADGPPGEATFSQPIGLALDSDGTLYVSDFAGNRIRRIDSEGNVSTVAGDQKTKFRDGPGITATFNLPRGITLDRQRGILYVADTENQRVRAIALR